MMLVALTMAAKARDAYVSAHAAAATVPRGTLAFGSHNGDCLREYPVWVPTHPLRVHGAGALGSNRREVSSC